jgi:hypothetical protein
MHIAHRQPHLAHYVRNGRTPNFHLVSDLEMTTGDNIFLTSRTDFSTPQPTLADRPERMRAHILPTTRPI